MVACWLWPFKVAVTLALWLLLMDPELAEKVALLWPDGMVTLAGTDSKLLLLASDTIAALVVAIFNLAVQVAGWLLAKAEGVQDNDVSCAPAVALALIVKVWEAPLSVAVSRAD